MKLSYQKSRLDNDLRVLTCAMPHTYTVGVGFYLSVGSRFEADEMAGAAHFIEHMLFKGTPRRPTPQAIATLLEGHGGLFNASTGRESTVLWAKMQQAHLDLALDALADMLRASLYLPEEIEKERRVILEEISASQDVPEELVSLLAYDLTWPNHPLGRDVAGTPASVAGLSRPALQTFLAQHYSPQTTVISVSGDVVHEQVVDSVANLLAGWSPQPSPSFLPAPLDGREAQVALIERPTEQTHLTLHLPGLARYDEDRFILGLLNVVLGEGMSSRLFMEIRERLGLAYAVDSYASFLADTGLLGIYAAVDPAEAAAALAAILRELRRLCDEAVGGDTLRVAKEFAKGRLMMSVEDTLSVASWFGRQEIQDGAVLTVEEVIEQMEAITEADMQRVARRLFRAQGVRLAVVGPHQPNITAQFQDLIADGALAS